METPKTRIRNRPRHVPTPKMSDRKKSLFSNYECKTTPDIDIIDEDSDLGPITLLEFSSSDESNDECEKPMRMSMKCRTSFKNILQEMKLNTLSVRVVPLNGIIPKSPEINKENEDKFIQETEVIKSNFMKTPREQITKVIEQPKISFRKSLVPENDYTPCNDQTSPVTSHKNAKWPEKRHLSLTDEVDSFPKSKVPKLDSKARTSLSFDESISTSSFYGNKDNENQISTQNHHNYFSNRKWVSPPISNVTPSSNANRRQYTTKKRSTRSRGSINKGVSHKIRKPRSKKQNSIVTDAQETRLKALSMKILKKSILSKNQTEEEQMITKLSFEQIRRANNILRKMKTPTILSETSSLNVEPSEDNQLLNIVNEQNVRRKFFKTGECRLNKYKLKENMFATMKHGQIRLEKKIGGPKQDFSEEDMELIEEHREVDDIIQKLSEVLSDNEEDYDLNSFKSIASTARYIEKFRSRIPYKTIDPDEIQRQHNLLEFLIFNNILTEENFKIFIMDPENFTAEADRIVNQFIVMVDTIDNADASPSTIEQNNKIAPPISPTSQISNMTSELMLDCPETEKTVELTTITKNKAIFPIFEKGFSPQVPASNQSSKIKSRKIWRPIGSQYQIDAGQKSYGAKTCSECGLLYSVNEPEEELLHLNFHNSFNILKFRGWKDENVVSEILEWGPNGRIIVVDIADNKRKWDRVQELMQMVDTELGFPNIEIPLNSVVYLAIAQNTVIGVCVAHHRTTAHRMIPNDSGSDVCTEETFPVKCGISKIWVAAPYRRQNVAKYMINCLRANLFFGTCLEFDDIAFSSPTADGKELATKLCKRPDFLVYF